MNKKKFPEGFFTKDRPIAKPRYIDADGLREYWLTNGKNERVYNTNDFLDSIDYQPTADVQPVVHCKGCWKRGTEHCSVNMPYKDKLIIAKVADNFFCKGGDEHDTD
jgi:hypothetical protein